MKSFAIAFTLSAVVAGAGAQSLRPQIVAFNKKICKLMQAKDVKGLKKAMEGGLTSDFKYVEGGQTQTYEQMAASMAAGIGQMKTMPVADAKLVSLKETGDKATATTLHTMRGTVVGADKKTHTMAFSGTSVDSYVKQGGKWKMSKMAWLKQTTLMDGKPMPAMEMKTAPTK